ncbi:MAG: hypothetical protein RLZZ22_296, partial [Pseudomonadota bacterium]
PATPPHSPTQAGGWLRLGFLTGWPGLGFTQIPKNTRFVYTLR